MREMSTQTTAEDSEAAEEAMLAGSSSSSTASGFDEFDSVFLEIPVPEGSDFGWADYAEAFVASQARKSRVEVTVSRLSAEELEKVRQAKSAEINQWLQQAVVEAASASGIPKAQLMRMRWVITKKPTGKYKARLVVQGFTDPQLAELRRESPTASKRARQLFFTMAATMRQHIWKGDVTAAFLQGDETERESATCWQNLLPNFVKLFSFRTTSVSVCLRQSTDWSTHLASGGARSLMFSRSLAGTSVYVSRAYGLFAVLLRVRS